jgi:hypothetical protein
VRIRVLVQIAGPVQLRPDRVPHLRYFACWSARRRRRQVSGQAI